MTVRPPGEGPSGAGARSAVSEEEFADLRRKLIAAVRRGCRGWLAAHAEDIVQNALVRLFEIRRRGGGIGGFNASYIQRAAYTATIDELRRHAGRDQAGTFGPFPDETPNPGIGPERHAAAMEARSAMRACLDSLVRPRRIAVTCHLLGYSVPDTASFLGWTAKKAEHLVSRGLDDLRRCLLAKGVKP